MSYKSAVFLYAYAMCAVALLLTSCGSQSATVPGSAATSHSQPETVQVVLTDVENIRVYSTQTIHNAQSAHNLYQAALALPKAPQLLDCPLDLGYRYRLTFFQNNGVIWHVLNASPTGCQFVYISQKDIRWANDAFWALLAHTMGEPAKDLFAYPSPTP